MSRKILFRGKRTDNGEWTQGYLFRIWGKAYICWGTVNDVPDMKEVDPETVCQYTGLTDKKGRKIFEGNILKIPEKKNHNVKFEYGQFCVGINCPVAYIRTECEVIGNIFDNPELLEGE